jgi:EpsI family protein
MKASFGSFAEPAIDRRKLLTGLLFCSAAGLAVWRTPRRKLDYLGRNQLERIIPKTIGRWNFVAASGLVIPPNDQLVQTLYSQLLTRVYWDGTNPPVMLLMAQSGSQTGFLQIHRPETCYTAGGYRISAVTPYRIDLGTQSFTANSMDADSGGPVEHVVYWTRVGNQMPASWEDQKLAVAEQNLRGVIPDAILVRLSVVSNDGAAARASIDEFVRQMFGAVPRNMRSVLVA